MLEVPRCSHYSVLLGVCRFCVVVNGESWLVPICQSAEWGRAKFLIVTSDRCVGKFKGERYHRLAGTFSSRFSSLSKAYREFFFFGSESANCIRRLLCFSVLVERAVPVVLSSSVIFVEGSVCVVYVYVVHVDGGFNRCVVGVHVGVQSRRLWGPEVSVGLVFFRVGVRKID